MTAKTTKRSTAIDTASSLMAVASLALINKLLKDKAEELSNKLAELIDSSDLDKKMKKKIKKLCVIEAGDMELSDETTEEVKSSLVQIAKDNMPKQTRAKTTKLKDPEAPKRPTSGYILFCKDRRASLKEEQPDLKATEIMKQLGAEWKELSPRKKEKYTAKAKEDKSRYDEELKDYTRPSDDELAKLDVNKGKGTPGKRTRAKKPKDAPKGPISAYLYYASDMRASVKEEVDEKTGEALYTGTAIAKELGRRWKELSDKQKKKWVKKSEADKVRYQEEMKAYKARKAEEGQDAQPEEPKEQEVEEDLYASGDEAEPVETPKKSKKSKSKEVEEEPAPVEETPRRSKRSKKSKEVEEETETPKSKKSKKVEVSIGALKRPKIQPIEEDVTEEELFGDDE